MTNDFSNHIFSWTSSKDRASAEFAPFLCRGPVAQLLARRTIDREVESSNPASDSDKCHRVAKGRGLLLANSTSSTEMRHPPALSLPTLTLVGMGEISNFICECYLCAFKFWKIQQSELYMSLCSILAALIVFAMARCSDIETRFSSQGPQSSAWLIYSLF